MKNNTYFTSMDFTNNRFIPLENIKEIINDDLLQELLVSK